MKRKFTSFFIAFLLLCCSVSQAQTPYAKWAKGFSASGAASSVIPRCMTVDGSGNTYIAGTFDGPVDLDPGTATVTANNLGAFVCKLNASGTYVWSSTFIGGSVTPGGIGVDASGNVVVTGAFAGSIDFDPGTGIANLSTDTISGSGDVFICKLNSSGGFVWAKEINALAPPNGNSHVAHDLAVDESGNIYTCGVFTGTADFDPSSTGTANLTSAGGWDVFVSKLDANGNYAWARSMGGDTGEIALAIAVDTKGNVYTTGFFDSKNADFDPGAGTAILSATRRNVFISKLNATGNFVWAKTFAGAGVAQGNDIVICPCGSVYTTGVMNDTLDFDPDSSGTLRLTGGSFVSKLDSNGNYLWAHTLSGTTHGLGIALDASGSDVYTTGDFFGTVDFDPGTSTANLIATTSSDVFVWKLNSSGSHVWARAMAAGQYVDNTSIAVDQNNYIYTSGNFTGTVDFDPSSSTANLSETYLSGFITKWAEGPAGVSPISGHKDVQIFPQPATDHIVIRCYDASLAGKEAVVYSIQGAVVARLQLSPTTSLDVSEWAPGVYVLRLPDGSGVRLVKE